MNMYGGLKYISHDKTNKGFSCGNPNCPVHGKHGILSQTQRDEYGRGGGGGGRGGGGGEETGYGAYYDDEYSHTGGVGLGGRDRLERQHREGQAHYMGTRGDSFYESLRNETVGGGRDRWALEGSDSPTAYAAGFVSDLSCYLMLLNVT